MNANKILGCALASLLALAPAAIEAEVLTVAPSQAAVFPADESGVTKVVLQFDLSGITSGEGRAIDEALLDWPLTGVASDRHTDYTLHSVSEPWTAGGVAAEAVPAFAEVPSATWEYDALDYQRNQGGFLRFDMRQSVQDWLGGEATNYGVVIATEDLSRTGLSNQLRNIRLTIRYGFRD